MHSSSVHECRSILYRRGSGKLEVGLIPVGNSWLVINVSVLTRDEQRCCMKLAGGDNSDNSRRCGWIKGDATILGRLKWAACRPTTGVKVGRELEMFSLKRRLIDYTLYILPEDADTMILSTPNPARYRVLKPLPLILRATLRECLASTHPAEDVCIDCSVLQLHSFQKSSQAKPIPLDCFDPYAH